MVLSTMYSCTIIRTVTPREKIRHTSTSPDGSLTKKPEMLTPERTMGDGVKGGAQREKCGPAMTGQGREPKAPP